MQRSCAAQHTVASDRSGVASPHLRVRLREPEAIAAALKVATDEQAKIDERLLCVRLFGEVNLPETVPALFRPMSMHTLHDGAMVISAPNTARDKQRTAPSAVFICKLASNPTAAKMNPATAGIRREAVHFPRR